MSDTKPVAHCCWLVDAWKPSREKYLKAWSDAGWHVVVWHMGQLGAIPDAPVELQDARQIIEGSPIADVFAYEHRHKSHASCADLFRYEVLIQRGGAYFDMDVFPDRAKPVVPDEPVFGSVWSRMYSMTREAEIRYISVRAQHDLIALLRDEAVQREMRFIEKGGYKKGIDWIVNRTGPGMVNECLKKRWKGKQPIFLWKATNDNTPENNNEHMGRSYTNILKVAAEEAST